MDFMMSGGYNVSAQIEQVRLKFFIFYLPLDLRSFWKTIMHIGKRFSSAKMNKHSHD